MTESVSMHDFMIYKSNLELERWLRKKLKNKSWVFTNPFLKEQYHWLTEPENLIEFEMPIDYLDIFWDYDFDNASYTATLEVRWNILNTIENKIGAGLKPTIHNAKNLCAALIEKIKIRGLEYVAHEGYTTGLEFTTKDHLQNQRKHVFYKVELVLNIGYRIESLEVDCQAASDLGKTDPTKTKFSFVGEWDTLETMVEVEAKKFDIKLQGSSK